MAIKQIIFNVNLIGLYNKEKVYNFVLHPETHRTINPYFNSVFGYATYNLLENKIVGNYV